MPRQRPQGVDSRCLQPSQLIWLSSTREASALEAAWSQVYQLIAQSPEAVPHGMLVEFPVESASLLSVEEFLVLNRHTVDASAIDVFVALFHETAQVPQSVRHSFQLPFLLSLFAEVRREFFWAIFLRSVW